MKSMVRFIKGGIIHAMVIVEDGEIGFSFAFTEILTTLAFLYGRHKNKINA